MYPFPYFQQQPIVSPGIPLALPGDVERLSEYQTFLRQQLEFFQAGPLDAQTNAQGRKRPVVVGQGKFTQFQRSVTLTVRAHSGRSMPTLPLFAVTIAWTGFGT